MRILLSLALASLLAGYTYAQSTSCAICVAGLTLVYQYNNDFSKNPQTVCVSQGSCSGKCDLFKGSWPVQSPVVPTDGDVINNAYGNLFESSVIGVDGKLEFTESSVLAFTNFVQQIEKNSDEPLSFFDAMQHGLKFLATTSLFSDPDLQNFDLSAIAPSCNPLDISCLINKVFNLHFPLSDGDLDAFSGATDFAGSHFRGSSWRGRDCDDSKDKVYPGRAVNSYGHSVDHNCNGIYGVDSATGKSYEELWCSGANAPYGLAILGDSATAHFHIPTQYLNARSLNFNGVLNVAANEADWPHCSWGTGYRDKSQCPYTPKFPAGKSFASIYQRLRERNLCMHRDFQNVGVNGARVTSMAPPGIIKSFARDQKNDRPMIVFVSLIGNDVCNGRTGTGSMTTPTQFSTSVKNILKHLDNVLPTGSHVALIPLVDGRVLYDNTKTQTHPLGVSYSNFYDFLGCNNSNPCMGWLTSNSTMRDVTTNWANSLNNVYETIYAQNKTSYKNFDIHLVKLNWKTLVNEYVATGGKAIDIFDRVDGFHPSTFGGMLLADKIWEDLSTRVPHWLPPKNPNNDKIKAKFGNQGGH